MKKKLLTLFLTLLIAVIVVGCGDGGRQEYLEELEKFRSSAFSTALSAEALSGLIQDKWREAINDRRDFNETIALINNLQETIDWRERLADGRSETSSIYLQLGNAPDGLERAEQITSNMFRYLDALVSLADSPSGSLQSYSAARRESIDGFLQEYRLLGDLIDEFSEE